MIACRSGENDRASNRREWRGVIEDNPASPLSFLSYFSAYDARTGERPFRYRIPSDVPVSAPCVTYAVDGEQCVAVAAGGTTSDLSKGDAIYVFGLPKRD